ncbi:hypothetical protein PISMIDRAFT_24904, partial [Pisolithus microcarpus 441]
MAANAHLLGTLLCQEQKRLPDWAFTIHQGSEAVKWLEKAKVTKDYKEFDPRRVAILPFSIVHSDASGIPRKVSTAKSPLRGRANTFTHYVRRYFELPFLTRRDFATYLNRRTATGGAMRPQLYQQHFETPSITGTGRAGPSLRGTTKSPLQLLAAGTARLLPRMTSYALTVAQISTVIVGLGFVFITRVMAKKESAHPPKVPSLLPWFGSAFDFASGPSKFLALCHAQFGPVFKVLLGGRNMIVVTTAESIHNALFTDYRVLTNRAEHYDHFHAVCGDTSLYPAIFDTFSHKLFPILDRRLSKRAVDGVTTDFAETVFQRLKLFSGEERVSLRRSLTEPVYVAVTAIFLGSKFSPDSYNDWLAFWVTLPIRLVRRPFWSFPSTRARGRLLQHITTCLQAANPDNDDDKLAGDFSKVIRENNIPFEAASPAVLAV